MKKISIYLGMMIIIIMPTVFLSCDDEMQEEIIPIIEPSQSEFDVEYTEGEVTVDFNSNVIFYATIEGEEESWLSYSFKNNCKTLVITYLENDTTINRVGKITVVKSEVAKDITISQAGNPNANNGKLQKLDLNYSVSSAGGYTVFSVPKEECDKIPIGATVVLECGDAGTISLLDASYAEFVGGGPVNGTFSFVWTQGIANITAENGITTGILRDGFEINSAYVQYNKSNLEYSINSQGGYTILSVAAEECAKIPAGSNVVFECPSDEGTISLLDPSYTEFAGGSPVNGKFSFGWTNAIVDITAENGITTGILRNGFDVSSMYFTDLNTELQYTITSQGGYTIFSVSLEECAKIPIGATVVLKCPSDAGTISLLDATYTEYAGGSPVNGEFSFLWTKDIAEITATAGITTGILRDGFDVNSMSCHN